MKKLFLVLVVASGCYTMSIYSAAEKAAAESVESAVERLVKLAHNNVSEDEGGHFFSLLWGYGTYLLQLQAVERLQAADPADSESSATKKARELADQIRSDAFKSIPEKVKNIFENKFKREILRFKSRKYNMANYLPAYEVTIKLGMEFGKKGDKAGKVPGGIAVE